MDGLLFAISLGIAVSCISAVKPVFLNTTYPHTITCDEGKGIGLTLHTFTATDQDGVVPTLNYTFEPSSASSMFNITETTNGSNTITAEVQLAIYKVFDYETQHSFKISATAFDGVEYSDLTAVLSININDVGEAPSLVPSYETSQSFTIQESPRGTKIGDPDYNVTDPDIGDTKYWSITGGNGQPYITIVETNGSIQFKVDYNRDYPDSLPEFVQLNVSITDKWGLSCSLIYYVTITDKNDNIPIFSPTNYNFRVDDATAVGKILTVVNASDNDSSSPNKDITFVFDTTKPKSEYFTMNGSEIVLQYTCDIQYGTPPFLIYLLAVDGGTPSLTGTAIITVSVPAATTLEPTTTNQPNAVFDALSTDNNLTSLLIFACIIAACILGYLLILCWRWHTYGRCLPDKCPGSGDCQASCTCSSPLDSESDAILTVSSGNSAVTKGSPLGPEAISSQRVPSSVLGRTIYK